MRRRRRKVLHVWRGHQKGAPPPGGKVSPTNIQWSRARPRVVLALFANIHAWVQPLIQRPIADLAAAIMDNDLAAHSAQERPLPSAARDGHHEVGVNDLVAANDSPHPPHFLKHRNERQTARLIVKIGGVPPRAVADGKVIGANTMLA